MSVPISNVTRRQVYAPSGAGGAGPYAFTFEILANTDIAVYKDDVLLTLTTHYTVTIASNGTGSVTITAAGLALTPTSPAQYAIVGNRTISRSTDFTTGGDFFANTLNDELDQQTIFNQQNAEGLLRAMQAPQTDPTSINMTLPRASVRAGKYLSFDDNGNPVAAEGRTEVAAVYAIRDDIAAVSAIDDQVVAVAGNETNIDTVAGISSNVTTVAGISANVTTVAGISSNVTSVAGNATNINTVATNIANVNSTGTNIASVNTVAGELGAGQDVTVVAANLSGTNTVGTVATNIANVNAVGTNISNVNAVNSNATNINTVAGQITPTNNVSTVAGVSASVATVAGISSNVTTVAGISSNVTTVAGVSANVTTVAGSIGSVNTVSGSIASVNTNATNIANINQNAANITAIQNASANATAAAASATTATTQATAAAASAAAASAVVLGNEPVRPAIRPSLLLDFANTEQLDPRITFTRASTATFYDGRTVAKAEENLLLRSQECNLWSGDNSITTANSTAAPDGTTTADTFAATGTGAHGIYPALIPVISGLKYTLSVYAKKNGSNFLQITSYSTPSLPFGTFFANFDLNAGTVGSTSGCTASIESVGNGWYRCIAADITSSATFSTAVQLALITSATAARFESFVAGTESVFVWGAQVEQRSTVTAYTPTTSAPITNYIPVLQTAASGVARFEHNPVTGESLGLEIEEQRTNLLLRSDDFANASWTKSNSSIDSNIGIAPDGTLTGDKLIANTSSSTHNLAQDFSATSGITYTVTFYVKAGEYSFCRIAGQGLAFSTSPSAYFNLSTGVVGDVSGSPVSQSITATGNGWYRISLTATASASSTAGFRLSVVSTANTESFAGNGFNGIFIWGAQLEAGAFATSYIPTVASQVTRAADSASMTGTNFSSWYNAAEGTLLFNNRYLSTSVSGNAGIEIYNSNAANNTISFRGSRLGLVQVNNVNQAVIGVGGVFASDFIQAMAVKTDDFAISYNGSAVVSDTSGVMPVVDAIRFNVGNSFFVNGTIKKIAYYPARVTNAQLQGLTTV
jgi:hypothetical protein